MNEFQFLEALRLRYRLNRTGDDCAILPLNEENDQLLTADMLVEDIDFRLAWTVPEFLGHKALAASLSDIAAMGGIPKWSMLSLGVPDNLWKSDFLDKFYEGWMSLATHFGVELVGGDISRVPGDFVIDSVVGGEVAHSKAIRRSTAKAGDAIFVFGTLGGAAAGLKLLENGVRYSDDLPSNTLNLLLKQLKPQPDVIAGNILQTLDIATSAIDLSDGLSSDLGHICRQSMTGAVIYSDRLPFDPDLREHFPPGDGIEMVLNGGEDFALLFSVDKDDVSAAKDIGAIHIGEMTSQSGCIELIEGFNMRRLYADGYRHF